MQQFSQEQLMQYLYGEASPLLVTAIERAIKESEAFKREVAELKATKALLDKELKDGEETDAPSEASVDAILKHLKTNL
jgi:anti-sigma factor RsiW